MPRKIIRHTIPADGRTYEAEGNGNIIHVAIPGNRSDEIEFYEMRDMDAPIQPRAFKVIATNTFIPDAMGFKYLGTTGRVQSLVWHLFEIIGLFDE